MPDYVKLLDIDLENIKKTDDSVSICFDVPASLPWFAGHFPDQAVLPAVITVEISDALIVAVYGVSPQLIANAKFKGPIFPGMNISVTLQKQNEDAVTIVWRKTSDLNPEQFLAEMKFRM
jgi:3-hydroxymyristoyl/3-hydroxydecanoyl-(acyl carrier protein) dehydratase